MPPSPQRSTPSCGSAPGTSLPDALHREADLISRLAEYYRQRFGEMIDRMNRHPSSAAEDLACLRLCVEAVDVMLSSQSQLAKAMGEITCRCGASHLPNSRAAA